MLSLRTLAITAITAVTASFGTVGCAQMPANQGAQAPAATPAAGMPMPMAGMDDQMKTMQAMHDKMLQAKTPEQKNALMAEQIKVMQESMTMMGAMGTGGMMGKGGMAGMGGMKEKPAAAGGMAGMQGKGAMEGDMAMHHQMMEKRMQMMHAMMQMMMDRMPPAPAKP